MQDKVRLKLTAHCVVKNEDKWVWFAIQSVLPYVERVLVFDTGSTDKTQQIIDSIKSSKIIFEKKGIVSREELVKLRQEQIDRTKTEWFLILDGDEVWPKKELENLIDHAANASKNIVAVFNKTRNCIGDIYHYLPEAAGRYEIAGHKGNLNVRLIRKKTGLKVAGTYPDEYYGDENGPVQEQESNLLFADCWYLHTTFLSRSTQDIVKTSGSLGKQKKWEKGLSLAEEVLPEVFKLDRPEFVENPHKRRDFTYEMLASLISPALNLKRLVKK